MKKSSMKSAILNNGVELAVEKLNIQIDKMHRIAKTKVQVRHENVSRHVNLMIDANEAFDEYTNKLQDGTELEIHVVMEIHVAMEIHVVMEIHVAMEIHVVMEIHMAMEIHVTMEIQMAMEIHMAMDAYAMLRKQVTRHIRTSKWKQIIHDHKTMWSHIDWKGKLNKNNLGIHPSIGQLKEHFESIYHIDANRNEIPKCEELGNVHIPLLDDSITSSEMDENLKKYKKGDYDFINPVMTYFVLNLPLSIV